MKALYDKISLKYKIFIATMYKFIISFRKKSEWNSTLACCTCCDVIVCLNEKLSMLLSNVLQYKTQRMTFYNESSMWDRKGIYEELLLNKTLSIEAHVAMYVYSIDFIFIFYSHLRHTPCTIRRVVLMFFFVRRRMIKGQLLIDLYSTWWSLFLKPACSWNIMYWA